MLWGKTLGIIGLGKIGKRSAFIGRLGFNMRVIASDPYVPQTDAEMIGVRLVDLETLLAESDVITIHAALTDETRGLIGEREIGLMKPTVQRFLQSRRTTLSCHVGSLREAMGERHRAGLENIARHCRGEAPLWVVNEAVLRVHMRGGKG